MVSLSLSESNWSPGIGCDGGTPPMSLAIVDGPRPADNAIGALDIFFAIHLSGTL
jgi:hypothetical protein